jgi:hypothetical protein
MEACVAMSPSPENSGALCGTLGAVVARVAQCSQVLLVLRPKIDQLRSHVSLLHSAQQEILHLHKMMILRR